jgi:hypothetical protein
MDRLREAADFVVPVMLSLGTGLALCIWFGVKYFGIYEIPAAGFLAGTASLLAGLPLLLEGWLCVFGYKPHDDAGMFYLISGAFLSLLGGVILCLEITRKTR